MKSFRRFAFFTTVCTYFLIFVGGLVRVSGAGLGCPDWPKCFGRWIPPLSKSQLPSGIDPATFNITLAWIEYTNRLVGVTVGLLIVVTAVLALRHFRGHRRILIPTLLAAVLVAVQGWQGSVVVASELMPLVVTVHMFLALVIVSLLIYVTQEAYHVELGVTSDRTDSNRKAAWWVALLWIGGIVQIMLGSDVRGQVDTIAEANPALTSSQWLARVGVADDLHMLLGLVMAFATIVVGIAVIKSIEKPSALLQQTVWGLILIAGAQIMLGLAMLVVDLAPLLRLFHLWAAGLYIGLVLVVYSLVRHRVDASAQMSVRRGQRRVLVYSLLAVVLLGIGSYFVVRQAEASRLANPDAASTYGSPYGDADRP